MKPKKNPRGVIHKDAPWPFKTMQVCPACRGSKKIGNKVCIACQGDGKRMC